MFYFLELLFHSVCLSLFVLHVHPLVKNQNTGRWSLDAFPECLLLIPGQLLRSVAHAAALKHSFVWHDAGLQQGHSLLSGYFYTGAGVNGATWAVWSRFPVRPRLVLIWSTLSSCLSQVPSLSSAVCYKVISDPTISCSSVKLWGCVISNLCNLSLFTGMKGGWGICFRFSVLLFQHRHY